MEAKLIVLSSPLDGNKPPTPKKTAMTQHKNDVVAPVLSCPDYWHDACADLMKRDRILRKLIPLCGPAQLMSRGDPFTTLARTIVGQQISVKAAQTVWDRLVTACTHFSAERVLALASEQLAACGVSRRKTEYIFDLAQHFSAGTVNANNWSEMEDEAVIKEMTLIRGVGRWSAEMYLIFNLMRPNVLPLDDLGLLRAISRNYFSDEPVTRSEAREVAANWEPWRTVATWYLWRSLDPVPVAY
ncbi:MAG: DNA-3-methyladenine glycosylase 2 family protein [Ottowia sp.]|nr:DNA-3-methyladenine glycosylase 2 family protein [Ottowia sp.]